MTDSPYSPIPHKPIHPSLQFLILLGLVIFVIIIGNIIAGAVIYASFGMDTLTDVSRLNITSERTLNAMWMLQLLGTTLPLLVTPVFFSYIIVREPDEYLKTTFHFPWTLIVIAFLVMIVSSPFMEFIGNFNQGLNLPQWMRDEENTIEKASNSMMQMKSLGTMLFNLAFIGFVTAVAEEFLFRGALQTILIRWFRNKHVAIWVTAILFSAFHMEFFGFIPRLMLGLFFGYFTAWSGSIWPSIWAHFVNNGSIVVLNYLAQQKIINLDLNDQHMFNTTFYIISAVITLFLLFVYQNMSNKRQIEDHGEELG